MKYLVKKSIVRIVGKIWMPNATCAQEQIVSRYDVENMRDEDGKITRDSVEQWLMTHSGDFQSVLDFSASIEDGDETIDIPWQSEEIEMTFCDCMCELAD